MQQWDSSMQLVSFDELCDLQYVPAALCLSACHGARPTHSAVPIASASKTVIVLHRQGVSHVHLHVGGALVTQLVVTRPGLFTNLEWVLA